MRPGKISKVTVERDGKEAVEAATTTITWSKGGRNRPKSKNGDMDWSKI